MWWSRSWRWFTCRLDGLSPESWWWRLQRHDHEQPQVVTDPEEAERIMFAGWNPAKQQ